MEAREIRVNNLFMFKKKELPEGKLLGVVDEIGKHHVLGFSFFNPDADLACLIADAEPIPLTEEWILKMGFEKISNSPAPNFSYQRSKVKVVDFEYNATGNNFRGWLVPTYGEKDYFMNGNFAEIKTVHQLQNLYYALTNTELTINL